jgi:hypothetical protein
MKSLIIAAAMTLCVVSFASADTLIMRDGTRIQGTVTGIAGRTITFRHADGASGRYPTSHVASLEFFSADRANPRAASARRLEVPAGTELMVRTIETIDSRNSGANQSFSGLVEQSVSDQSGHAIIPEGSSAQLVIRQGSANGKTGSPEMVLDVQSVTVGGRRYLVADDSDADIGASRRATQTIAGSAAVGTIIGAIPVGGTGVTTQVLTKGRDVKVPAETLLRFRLDKPVTLRAEQ